MNPAESLESLFNYVKILEGRIQELENTQEEFKALKREVEELKNKSSEDHGLSLLTPRLRGPPGKMGVAGEKGDRGNSGQNGRPGDRGGKGDKGERGLQGPKGDPGISDSKLTSCSDAMDIFPSPRSPKQSIYPDGKSKNVEVLCDFEVDGGGWTVIQKRSSGPKHEFDKNWNDYVQGFGSVDGNFWLGLENIHALTKNGDQELRIELEDFQGNKKYAKYSTFSISSASDFYRLSISGYSGDAGDSMTGTSVGTDYHINGWRFTTKDKDNDKHSEGNCATKYDRWGGGGGWWHNYCTYASLNGLYNKKGEEHGITWYTWKERKSLAKTEMKIRTRK